MSRKNHAPGAGGGKEKGRSAGDQQIGGVAGGKLGGSGRAGSSPTGTGDRAREAGHMGGQHQRGGMERNRQPDDTEQ